MSERDRDSAARLCSPSCPGPVAWAVTIGPAGNSSVYEAFAAHQKDEAEALARECLFGDSSKPLPLVPLCFAPRWIPVSERLPNEGERVLVCEVYEGRPDVRVAIKCNEGWEECEAVFYRDDRITHWMPLPEPPR